MKQTPVPHFEAEVPSPLVLRQLVIQACNVRFIGLTLVQCYCMQADSVFAKPSLM